MSRTRYRLQSSRQRQEGAGAFSSAAVWIIQPSQGGGGEREAAGRLTSGRQDRTIVLVPWWLGPINITLVWPRYMDTTMSVAASLALWLSLFPSYTHTHTHTQAFNDSYLIGKGAWRRGQTWPGWCVNVQGASKYSWMVLMRVENGDIKREWVHFSL